MKRSKNLSLPHRRKREGKTDFKLRLRLLKSRKPRLVVRKSLRNIICQIVKFDMKGDHTIVSADSKELKKFGWNLHGGNVSSAYLTGLLCAEKAKKHKINHAVFDIGLYDSTPGNRLYSALKGALDGGLDVPHSEGILPKNERISGQHVSRYAEHLKTDKLSHYKKVFSSYIKMKIDPKEIPKVFEETKKRIESGRHVSKHPAKKEHPKKTTSKKKK